MEEKKQWRDWVALAVKIIAGFALYFGIAILITTVDKVTAVDKKVWMGYVLLLDGCVFLLLQFLVTLRVVKDLTAANSISWVSAVAKSLVGLTFFFSVAGIAGFSEKFINPDIVTKGYTLVFTALIFVLLHFVMATYGISDVMHRKQNEEESANQVCEKI